MKPMLTAVKNLPKAAGSVVTLDTETTGLDLIKDIPFLLGIKMRNKKYAVRWDRNLVDWLNDNIPDMKPANFHHAKFDLHMLLNGGVKKHIIDNANIHCTMVSEALLNEHLGHYSLEFLGQRWLGMQKVTDTLYQELADIFGGKADRKQMVNLHRAPIGVSIPRVLGDVDITEALFSQRQQKELAAQELDSLHKLEMQVIIALMHMERIGVPVNMKELDKVEKEFSAMVWDRKTDHPGTLDQEIFDMVGFYININSGKQIEKAFNKLKLPVKYKADTGNPTFDKEVLESNSHPLCALIIKYRSTVKMLDSFLTGIRKYIRPNNRIHTTFHSMKADDYGTITGRLSAHDPNLLQIPSPKRNRELGPKVRAIFSAPRGYQWTSADWEQFEFRIFAHYAKDEKLLEMYRKDPTIDFHTTVSVMTGVRRNPEAKQINLGLVFGMGAGKMAQKCHLPTTSYVDDNGKEWLRPGPEAKAIFDKYHEEFPGAKKFINQASSLARQRGYVRTMMYKRRLRFPGGKLTHKAGGFVFQATAADQMKRKLVELDKEYNNTDVQLMLAVHDEFDVLNPTSQTKKVQKRMKEIMEDIPELRVPILAEVTTGPNWAKASGG